MKRFLLLTLLTLAALLGLYWYSGDCCNTRQGTDVNAAITQVLKSNNAGHLTHSFTDGIANLEGQVKNAGIKDTLLKAVAAVPGVQSVTNKLSIAAATPFMTRFLKLDSGKFLLEGSAPSEADKTWLGTAVTEALPGFNVSNKLSVNDNAPAGWKDAATKLISGLGLIKNGNITLGKGNVSVMGNAHTQHIAQLKKTYTDFPEGYAVNFSSLKDAGPFLTKAEMDCQTHFNEALTGHQIKFRTASAKISSKSTKLLKTLAKVGQECPEAGLRIEGHTDASGDAEKNKVLSQERADVVKAALVKYGLADAKIASVGYGSAKPIADNNTDEGKAKNRRIEFKVLGH